MSRQATPYWLDSNRLRQAFEEYREAVLRDEPRRGAPAVTPPDAEPTTMTDPRLRQKMMQYHDEGEHIFPEPACPSCNAERLDLALARPAKLLADAPWWAKNDPWLKAIAGWAEAVEALDIEHRQHCLYEQSSSECQGPCSQAIAAFCDAMLGKEGGHE